MHSRLDLSTWLVFSRETRSFVSLYCLTEIPMNRQSFGSAARDEMTDQSDVDIALLFSTAAEVKVQKKLLYKT
jgi:predicted nucleotidyltransferase